jgi:hypothetical protein
VRAILLDDTIKLSAKAFIRERHDMDMVHRRGGQWVCA